MCVMRRPYRCLVVFASRCLFERLTSYDQKRVILGKFEYEHKNLIGTKIFKQS